MIPQHYFAGRCVLECGETGYSYICLKAGALYAHYCRWGIGVDEVPGGRALTKEKTVSILSRITSTKASSAIVKVGPVFGADSTCASSQDFM